MKKLLGITLALVFSLSGIGVARADILMYSDGIPLATTDWSDTVSIPKFDSSLGTLNSIQFMVMAHIEGSTFYENQETSPTDVSLTLSAQLSLLRPDLSSIITVSPSTMVMETAGAYDGMLDFDGPSGSTFNNLFADIMQSASSPPPAGDLALFTGAGSILLPVTAMGTSSGSGPGNWIFGFSLSASADVKVVYDYTPVPEPMTLAMVLPGLLACAFRRR